MNVETVYDSIEETKVFPVMDCLRNPEQGLSLDLSVNNEALQGLDLSDVGVFQSWINDQLKKAGATFGYGGYQENRVIYRHSAIFDGEEQRSIHLGVDIWAPAGSPVYLPVKGTLHSLADNNAHGDYGPTLIFSHQAGEYVFQTLYGHLSKTSLEGKDPGSVFEAGDLIAWLGDSEVNVGWPPHLHFQVILDIGDYQGDYPGVCKPSEKQAWLANSPDPEPLLGIRSNQV